MMNLNTEFLNKLPDDVLRHYLKAGESNAAEYCDAMRHGRLVLVSGVETQQAADNLIKDVCSELGIFLNLKLQAEFASIQGHRQSVGNYCMTVNKRNDYQFIPPHSEGTASVGIQLGCLYCRENTTDGGGNLLFRSNSNAAAWSKFREVSAAAELSGKTLGRREEAILRANYGVTLPDGILKGNTEIVRERGCVLPGIRIFDVLKPLKTARSRILDRDVHVLWDNVATAEFDLAADFMLLLQSLGVLRLPGKGAEISILDVDFSSHFRRSGVKLLEVFEGYVFHKLAPGELLFFDNFSWAHSTANWTPNSGTRDVVAAFA